MGCDKSLPQPSLSLRGAFLATKQSPCDDHYLLAYSGGMDSLVLLTLLCELRQQTPINLRAIHIHHGLSPNADAWAIHCQQVCDALNVPLDVHRIKLVLEKGDSLEEAAREARYRVFAETLKEGEVLLTAHHQDDQAETLLLQLVRGAGLKGLSGMPVKKPFAKGFHERPLLKYSREEIKAYAEERGLEWVEDESNKNTDLSRNFIRHNILPMLKTQWPSVDAALSRSAAHCAEAQALLEEYALSDYEKIKGSKAGTLSVKGLLSLSPEKQRLLLRIWIQQGGFPLPDNRKLTSIQQTVLTAAPDRNPCVKWGEAEVRRYRDDLYVFFCHPEECFLRRRISSRTSEYHQGILRHKTPQDDSSIRYRRGGEKINIPGRGRLSLKNLFQEWGVPPWERDSIPLVYEGEELVGVVGYYCHPEASFAEGPPEVTAE